MFWKKRKVIENQKTKIYKTSIGLISHDTLVSNKKIIEDAYNKLISDNEKLLEGLNKEIVKAINYTINNYANRVSGYERYEDRYDTSSYQSTSDIIEGDRLLKKKEKLIRDYTKRLKLPKFLIDTKNTLDYIKELKDEKKELFNKINQKQ